MCLLIAKPANVEFPSDWEEICESAHRVNDDGMGYGTRNTLFKSVVISPKDFALKTKKEIHPEEPAIIHFRWSTGGRSDWHNCHPFKLPDGTIFAHNGVIDEWFTPTQEYSDTAILSRTVENFDQLYEVCNKMTSAANKFAMIHPDHKDLTVCGWEFGEWKDGLWYSNKSYKTKNFVITGFDSDYEPNWVTIEDDVREMLNRYESWQVDGLIEDIRFLVDEHGYEEIMAAIDYVQDKKYA